MGPLSVAINNSVVLVENLLINQTQFQTIEIHNSTLIVPIDIE
jgi:hypothetical protein